MLDDVIGAYIDTLTEREFDAPFMSLLRAMGFFDIHFLHGQFEFGKDFVAKLGGAAELAQFAFQSKAGNIDGAAWREVRTQLEDIRTNALAHPSFDQNLPRRMVLVTTGRLTGAASLNAQQYKEHVKKTSGIQFDVWDRERLIELLAHRPELNLAGPADAALTVVLGEIEAGKASIRTIERFSRDWMDDGNANLRGAAVVALVIANRLRTSNRLDLACFTILCLARAASAHWHNDRSYGEALDLADKTFAWYAGQLWDRCTDDLLTPETMVVSSEAWALVTYPLRCLRTAESLSMFVLLLARNGDARQRNVEDYLLRFIRAQPGAGHPISDNWAASLISIGLVVGRRDVGLLDN